MIELVLQYGRYGYRRIAALLRDAGWQVIDKRGGRRATGAGCATWREPDVAAARARASRDRLSDCSQAGTKRLHAAAMVAPHHIPAAVEETRRCVQE